MIGRACSLYQSTIKFPLFTLPPYFCTNYSSFMSNPTLRNLKLGFKLAPISIISIVSILAILSSNRSKDDDYTGLMLFLLFFGPILYFAYRYIWINRNRDLWEKGIFPANLKYKRKYLLEAYICLAARLLVLDRESYKEKLIYMNRYFSKHFPKSNYNFGDSLIYSYNHPIQEKTVATWLKQNLPGTEYKLQVLYFLFGLSAIDGTINNKELQFLKTISDSLQLSVKDFESIWGMYRQKQEKAYEESRRPSKSKREEVLEIACQILGVSNNASFDEAKKAYRRLVKLHHPDKFATESEADRVMARERFMKIQKAFEAFEQLK